MKARDFINAGEKAVVIFTHGPHFEHGLDGSGSTENWRVNRYRAVDRVIICLRDDEAHTNAVYVADYAGVGEAEGEGRFQIQFTKLNHVGYTSNDWAEFAESAPSARNPVRYLQ